MKSTPIQLLAALSAASVFSCAPIIEIHLPGSQPKIEPIPLKAIPVEEPEPVTSSRAGSNNASELLHAATQAAKAAHRLLVGCGF